VKRKLNIFIVARYLRPDRYANATGALIMSVFTHTHTLSLSLSSTFPPPSPETFLCEYFYGKLTCLREL
jgi:hypothetical protein